MPSLLSPEELIIELSRRPGLIPARIDSRNRQILWVDLEEFHCYEGFFEEALLSLATLRGAHPPAFLSDLLALESVPVSELLQGSSLVPSAFIFHAGRCGSTLLTRVLARSRTNMVFSEAAAHNQIWAALAAMSRERGTDLYRRLILEMGRRRLSSHRAHVIKFTSYNIVQFDRIRAAFPDTPALFLFREPAALLQSYHREPPRWIGQELGVGKVWNSPESAVEDFFTTALSVRDPAFRCLDYSGLTPPGLQTILRYFNMALPAADLRQMAAEFFWDAKSSPGRAFVSRPSDSESTASSNLSDLYSELRNRSHADWK